MIAAGKVFCIYSKSALSAACDSWSRDNVGGASSVNPSECIPSIECESSGREAGGDGIVMHSRLFTGQNHPISQDISISFHTDFTG